MPDRQIMQALTENPELATRFYWWASEIVDDYEDYGPVLQANEDGEYDGETMIIKLRHVRNELIEFMQREATS